MKKCSFVECGGPPQPVLGSSNDCVVRAKHILNFLPLKTIGMKNSEIWLSDIAPKILQLWLSDFGL